MKIMITMLLVAAALVAAAPTASATCEVSDPTSQTTTCIDSETYNEGDETCEANGIHQDAVYASSDLGGYGAVNANVLSGCYNDGFNAFSWTTADATVSFNEVGPVPGGTVGAGFYDYAGDLDFCGAYVFANHEATGNQVHSTDC